MKLVKTASGKETIKISKSDWEAIGKRAGWIKESKLALEHRYLLHPTTNDELLFFELLTLKNSPKGLDALYVGPEQGLQDAKPHVARIAKLINFGVHNPFKFPSEYWTEQDIKDRAQQIRLQLQELEKLATEDWGPIR